MPVRESSLAKARDERAPPPRSAGTDPRNGPFGRYHQVVVLVNLLFTFGAAMDLHSKVSEVAREPAL